jgi:HlyD family secretion protein
VKALVVVVVVLLLAGAGWFFFIRPAADARPAARYRTAKVDRGEVVEGVAASGTVQPVELVQVGTQISGVIQELHADFNSHVKAGQVIAKLDSRRLEAQVAQDAAAVARARSDVDRVTALVAQSEAEVTRARASVDSAQSDVARVDALLVQARADLDRQRQLFEKRLTAQASVDAAVATAGSLEAQRKSADAAVAAAKAALAVSETAVAQNRAQLAVAAAAVTQAEAQERGDRVNLDYATITSPVDGTVVSRNVDVGQTVAASLQAPTLFVIAKDLTKVQIQTSVPEADIGRVREKQVASFTVDAYPERTFPGVVAQVRLASTTVSNVVTYPAVVDADNPGGVLLPGMTANVVFEVARSPKDALRVPASALRVQPAPELLVATTTPPRGESRATGGGAPASRSGRGGRRGRGGGAGAGGDASPPSGGGADPATGPTWRPGTVYVVAEDNRLRPITVRAGLSDGTVTVVEPVEPGSLDEGTEVVTAILREEEPATTNPFAPPRFGGGRGGAGRGGGR